jgi:hypothetical protein
MSYTVLHGFLHPPDPAVVAAAGRVAPLGDCLMCGQPVGVAVEHLGLRGDLYVHAACATYRRRDRRGER